MYRKFGILLLAACASQAQAKVDDMQAVRLGQDLTPLGAERAGNAAGTIPAWTGGVQPPAGYEVGMHHPDPYAADPVLYQVDQSNVGQYAALLPEGLRALVEQYPDFHLRVFPTRRSASNPQRIYDATRLNAVNAELIANGNGIKGAFAGIPFPIPQDGMEVIWNHVLHYKGDQTHFVNNQAVVINGSPTYIKRDREIYYVYNREGMTQADLDNTSLYYKYRVTAPAKLSGTALVVQDPLDQVLAVRKAWRYSPADRRVRRLPSLAYDSLQPDTSGLATADVVDSFNGAPDRYDWKLVGKKEMYIPYNAYRLDSPQLKYDDIIKAGHINQDLTRYELHRVWEVEATLKPGERHIYAKRTFFIDEDTWQAAVIDHYDGRDTLWRVAEAHAEYIYNDQVPLYAMETLYDLVSGRYLVMGMKNEEKNPYVYNYKANSNQYTPAALRNSGVR
ncbi:MAG TPA: DUF1329 domain-containing protein [Pseudomonas sp.]|nr:DUF1329 domain-containing protein [Pseudomonas sp.]